MKELIVVFTGLALITFQKKHVDLKALVPLVTTRTRLEANLGTPTSGNGNIFVYETPNEKLHVWIGKAVRCEPHIPTQLIKKPHIVAAAARGAK